MEGREVIVSVECTESVVAVVEEVEFTGDRLPSRPGGVQNILDLQRVAVDGPVDRLGGLLERLVRHFLDDFQLTDLLQVRRVQVCALDLHQRLKQVLAIE